MQQCCYAWAAGAWPDNLRLKLGLVPRLQPRGQQPRAARPPPLPPLPPPLLPFSRRSGMPHSRRLRHLNCAPRMPTYWVKFSAASPSCAAQGLHVRRALQRPPLPAALLFPRVEMGLNARPLRFSGAHTKRETLWSLRTNLVLTLLFCFPLRTLGRKCALRIGSDWWAAEIKSTLEVPPASRRGTAAWRSRENELPLN